MRKHIYFLPALLLTACVGDGPDQGWVAELNKAQSTPNAIWLAGDGSKGELYGIPTREAAFALSANNKGKIGTISGYIWKVGVKGNRAAIEVIPNFSGGNARRCSKERNIHPLDCLKQKRGTFSSSVTCFVSNWPALNTASKGTLTEDLKNKWDAPYYWHHVAVEGTIKETKVHGAKFGRYGGDGSAFGDTGGAYTDGFRYRSIHLNPCRVLTFRGKALIPNS